MHSRIFQLSTKPIMEDDYIDESYYYDHWFTNSRADYVADSDRRNADIVWLSDTARGMTVANSYNDMYPHIIITDKEKYFDSQWREFVEILHEIKDMSIKEFIEGDSYTMYKLKSRYNDECGFYVNLDGSTMTFDEFVRNCDVNVKYYIGATLDYHF